MKKSLLSCVVLGAFVLVSCKKSDVDGSNSANQAAIAFQLNTSNESSTLGKMEGSKLVWKEGYAHAWKLIFDGVSDCNGKIEDDHHHKRGCHEYEDSMGRHHQVVEDTVDNGVIPFYTSGSGSFTGPVIDTVPVTPCQYRNSNFVILLQPADTGAALVLKGSFDSIPVEFRVNQSLILKGTLDTAAVSGGKHYQAVITLNLAKLSHYLSSADLGAATRDASGVIIISSTSNRELYNRLLLHFYEMAEHSFRHE